MLLDPSPALSGVSPSRDSFELAAAVGSRMRRATSTVMTSASATTAKKRSKRSARGNGEGGRVPSFFDIRGKQN